MQLLQSIFYKWPSILLLIFLSYNALLTASASNMGEALYIENCAICHGNNGQGGMGIPLALNSFLESASDNYLKQTIRLGRPDRIMPSFYWLSESEINDIIQFIGQWRKSAAPTWKNTPIIADSEKGKKLFSEKCESCHGRDGQGGKGSGMRFSRTRNSPITAPALNNQGLLNSAPDSMLHFIIKHGRKNTPMPSAKALNLKANDINHLVSFIRSFQQNNLTKKPLYDEEPASLIEISPYSYEETIENVKRAIVGSNFVHIRDQSLTEGFKTDSSESPKQTIIYFCNFSFLYKALKIDPRVGMFLPCRVTVVEHQGQVQIMTINPKHLSQLFNNNELDEACDHMYDVYTSILEDASL